MELYPERGYFFCGYCGSFHFPESAGADGIRMLGDGTATLECPVCAKRLATAILDDAHPVQYCRNCRGVLLPRRAFAEVVHARRAWATAAPAPPVPLKRAQLQRRVNCPNCHVLMMVHPYYGPGNIVMDSCEPCNAVWLDFGELKQIVDAPGRDRGGRGVPERVIAGPAVDRPLNRGGLDVASHAGRGVDLLAALTDLLS
jgi:Zn-finger nucleic acid-binding protein